jgi:hypothetical protein
LRVSSIQQQCGVAIVRIGGVIIEVALRPPNSRFNLVWLRQIYSIRGKLIIVVLSVHEPGELELLEIVHAVRPLCFGLCRGQSGKQQAGQDRDDGNHDQQFD